MQCYLQILYDGNSHYKNTSAVHHAVILKIEKTRSLDEILQSGEYKKRLVITKLLNTIIWGIWNLHWLKIPEVKNGL